MSWSRDDDSLGFLASDAALMATSGFDVVRRGILWQGLESGTVGPNDPSVCTPGRRQ